MEALKKHLQALKQEAETEISKIPETFNNAQEAENYSYYDGALTAINNIIEFIEGQKQ